jgi:hypothetical protein
MPDRGNTQTPVHVLWFISIMKNGKEVFYENLHQEIPNVEKDFVTPDFIEIHAKVWAEDRVAEYYESLDIARDIPLDMDFDKVNQVLIFRSLYENIERGEYMGLYKGFKNWKNYDTLPNELSIPRVIFTESDF